MKLKSIPDLADFSVLKNSPYPDLWAMLGMFQAFS
jgi:hypothetical protein